MAAYDLRDAWERIWGITQEGINLGGKAFAEDMATARAGAKPWMAPISKAAGRPYARPRITSFGRDPGRTSGVLDQINRVVARAHAEPGVAAAAATGWRARLMGAAGKIVTGKEATGGFRQTFGKVFKGPLSHPGAFGATAMTGGITTGIARGFFKEIPKLLSEDLEVAGLGGMSGQIAQESIKRSLGVHPKSLGATGSMVFGMYNTRHGGQPTNIPMGG
jgi:hypothetical protein